MFMLERPGTKFQVLLSLRALKSSVMAWFYSGIDSASTRLCGSGAMVVMVEVCKDKGCFGLVMSSIIRVVNMQGGGGGSGGFGI